MDKIYSLHSVKKEVSINDKPHETCDNCGMEITETPMMNMGRTICQSCFWNELYGRRIKKCSFLNATDAEQS